MWLIKRFIDAYPESAKTRRKMKLGQKIQNNGYATMKQLLRLVKWKFPIAIRHVNVPNNSEEDVKVLTRIVLRERLSDSQQARILMGLTGVRVRMASAILTLIFPDRYGTFDVNAREALEDLGLIGKDELSDFKLDDYLKYLKIIRGTAGHLRRGCTPRDVDRALYYYGRHLNKKCHIDGNCPLCPK